MFDGVTHAARSIHRDCRASHAPGCWTVDIQPIEHSVTVTPRSLGGPDATPSAPGVGSRPNGRRAKRGHKDPAVAPEPAGESASSSTQWWRVVLVHAGWAALGAVLATAWVWRHRITDVFGPWWFLAVPLAACTLLLRDRPKPPKSAAHPVMQVKRSQHWSYRPVMRPLGRRSSVPNVFVDGDSFSLAAWPGADLVTARRWTVDASEVVASRFGTQVAVVVGDEAAGAPGREHVQVVPMPPGGSMRDALWELVAPVDPDLPILFVTDDDEAALAARAHGAQIMPCRGWMTLTDRTAAQPLAAAGALPVH